MKSDEIARRDIVKTIALSTVTMVPLPVADGCTETSPPPDEVVV